MAKGKGLFSFLGKDKISYQKLARLNIVVAALLGLQALVILILADNAKGIVGITSNYLSNDLLSSDGAGGAVWLPASQHLFDLHLSYVLAALLLVVALSRLIAGNFKRKKYEAGLRNGINKHRWIEIGALMSLLMVGVALVAGIYDLVTLIFIVWLSSLMAWLGYKFEQYSKKSKLNDMQLFTAGFKAIVMTWLAVAIYVAGALIWGGGLATYTYFIFASLAVITGGLAYNTYKSFKKTGRWSDNLWPERVYIALAVVGTSALAWQVFFGTLR